MADMYSIVKKQDEKIDELLKAAKENKDLLMGIDTRLMSEPSHTNTSALTAPEKIQVDLPANIVTTDDVSVIAEAAVKKQTDFTVKAFTHLYTNVFPNQSGPQSTSPVISDEQIERIAQAAANKAADKAVNKRYDKLDATADTVMHRIYNLVHGAIWAAIPKWAYIVFAIAVLAAGGFGYGFFYQLNENAKLKDVEWLYRYERGLNRDMNVVMHRERLMLHGRPNEVDSMKSLIRHHERRANADTTFVFYYPSNP